ncbi:eukaryotic translation initiation factor 3 subunit 6 [Coprinopsis sp. MPI-PUGE-AT-0042]|nr:eukaryotic translation initiation factor 3 subunit 6 [Coprinopsis sp. MPI-PUGE-AT-0042]
MAETDLTKTILPFLDRHLGYFLLDHLTGRPIFNDQDVKMAQYELVKGTEMYDFAGQLFKSVWPDKDVPSEFEGKKQEAVSKAERLQQEAQAVQDVIENPDVAQSLRQDKNQNLAYLKDNYGVTLEHITALYNFGKFLYASGNYSGAADYLYHFRVLSTDNDLNTSASWGKLACDILTGKWDTALEELNSLREAIDSRTSASILAAVSAAAGTGGTGGVGGAGGSGGQQQQDPALVQLNARTWLVHWSLFVYFNHPEGRTFLLETFLSPTYLNTIQTASPWVLRYLAASAILSRKASLTSSSSSSQPMSSRVRHAIKEVVRVIQTEEYQYTDPVTQFLKELYVDFDFEAAQNTLKQAVQVVANDFFLNNFEDEFLDNARYLISEAYCRIHQRIDIADLSNRLNLSQDEGEKYIVNLIRETRMGADAKIDLGKNVIEINRPPQPVYQTVIEKTRGLTLRTQAIGAAISRPPQQPQQQQQNQQQQGQQQQEPKAEAVPASQSVAVGA